MLYSATDVILYKVLLIDVAIAKTPTQIHLRCPLFLDLMDKTCQNKCQVVSKSGFLLSVLLIWNVSHRWECV